ncbi:MAG: PEP-CTERM sorting domain-containing protein [Chthoniobacteraceae bacterium]
MKFNLVRTFIAPTALALFVASASASTIDYSNLSNWTSTGDVATTGNGSISLTNASSTYTDDYDSSGNAIKLNLSGTDPVTAGGTLENAVGVQIGGLDLDAVNQAEEGSAVTLTLTVNVGDTLTIDWNMLTNDTTASGIGADYFFLTVNGQLQILGSSGSASQASTSANYAAASGAQEATYVFTEAGTVTVGLGVVDVGDYANSTEVDLSEVTVTTTAVPEPQTYAMILAGLGGIAAAVQTQRKQQA